MIETHEISKSFADNLVLDKVSVSFKQGQTNLVIGQSGSGKTVLIKCLVGLYEADHGQVIYDGRSFTNMTDKQRMGVRKEVGMLFQGGALFDSRNVEENVMFPLSMFTNMSWEEKRERVNFCLKRVKLENVNKLLPSELSGGMVKRVAIARAISMNPKYLFCDEPNSGLDPRTASVIDNLIKEITLEYNITTIINTHDMNSVLEIGDSIAYIFEGKLWWTGNKKEILNTENKELNDFVFSSELTRRLK